MQRTIIDIINKYLTNKKGAIDMTIRHQARGFTLIELLAVITIIGILATLAAVGVANASRRARDGKRQSDITNVKKALEQYNQDNAVYPIQATAANVSTALTGLTTGGYMQALPTDPKNTGNNQYMYITDAAGTNYVVYDYLEYTKSKESLTSPADCATVGTVATKGNGVLQNAAGDTPCFRVTND